MKARIRKPWDKLSSNDQDKLKAFAKEIAIEAAERQIEIDGRIMLDIYMKMACLVLHDAFGFGEKRLRLYIGNHKRLFSRQVKLVQRGEQLEYLNGRMAEIFRKDGFPQKFIDDLLGEVEVKVE
jgi:ribosomal protein S10